MGMIVILLKYRWDDLAHKKERLSMLLWKFEIMAQSSVGWYLGSV